MKTLRSFGTNLLFLSLFILLLTASLFGIKIPEKTAVASVSSMQLTTSPVGLTLYQGYRGKFYNVSPYNDFYILANGSRSSFITIEEIEQKSFTVRTSQNPLTPLQETLLTYGSINYPSMTFEGSQGEIMYTSSVSGNHTTIQSSFTPKTTSDIRRVGITFSYNADDIILDQEYNAYNFWEESDLDTLESIQGKEIQPQRDRMIVPLSGKKVAIINPHTSAIMIIRASQHQQIVVNRNTRIIEVVQSTNPRNTTYISSVAIEVIPGFGKEIF